MACFCLAGHQTKHENTKKKQIVVFSALRLAVRKGENTERQGATRQMYCKNTTYLRVVFLPSYCPVFVFSPAGRNVENASKRQKMTLAFFFLYLHFRLFALLNEDRKFIGFRVVARKGENSTKIDFGVFLSSRIFAQPCKDTKVKFVTVAGRKMAKGRTLENTLKSTFVVFSCFRHFAPPGEKR